MALQLPEITPELIEVVWNNMPGPHEIDTENPEAAKRLALAILRAVLDKPGAAKAEV